MTKDRASRQAGFGWIPILLIGVIFLSPLFFYFYPLKTSSNPQDIEYIRSSILDHKNAVTSLHAQTLSPGTGSNETRKELNNLLNTILTTELDGDQRLNLSRDALRLAQKLEAEIQEITTNLDTVYKTTKNISSLSEDTHRGMTADLTELLTLTLQITESAKRAQSLLLVMNEDIVSIFRQISSDDGSLTQEHIEHLNSSIPEAEKNFDELYFLYKRQETLHENIESVSQTILTNLYTN